jgi:hypothetical protein
MLADTLRYDDLRLRHPMLEDCSSDVFLRALPAEQFHILLVYVEDDPVSADTDRVGRLFDQRAEALLALAQALLRLL